MEAGSLVVQLAFFAAVTESLVEAIKRAGFVQQFNLSESIQSLIFQLLSMALGIIATVGAQINILALSPIYGQIAPLAGQILTGILVGRFSNSIYRVVELLTGKLQEPPPEVPPEEPSPPIPVG